MEKSRQWTLEAIICAMSLIFYMLKYIYYVILYLCSVDDGCFSIIFNQMTHFPTLSLLYFHYVSLSVYSMLVCMKLFVKIYTDLLSFFHKETSNNSILIFFCSFLFSFTLFLSMILFLPFQLLNW